MSKKGIEKQQEAPEQTVEERLDSWKEIAAYLKRDVSTVQRWEKREGLPVHRHVHNKLSTVCAYKLEIDAWWEQRRAEPEATRTSLLRSRQMLWGMAGVVVVVTGIVASILQRRSSSGSDFTTRRVWVSSSIDRLGTVSTDGRYFTYGDPATSNLVIREVASGRERFLTRKPEKAKIGGALQPMFSRDGKHIAYVWDEGFFDALCVIGIDGADPRVLFRDPDLSPIDVADWSPDGRHILARLRRKDRTSLIVLIRVADRSVRVLKTLDQRVTTKMSFSPDGRYVAYDLPRSDGPGERDIFALALSDGRESALVDHPADDALLGWAPDGKTILFASNRSGTMDAWMVRVNSSRPDGEPILVKKDLGKVTPVGFTHDGSFYYRVQTWDAEVYVAKVNVAARKVLAAPAPAATSQIGSNRSPDWSPDGRYLAYVSQPIAIKPSRSPLIVVQSVGLPQERKIRPKLNLLDVLRWSRDGSSFLTSGYDHIDRPGLFRVDAHTGDTVAIVRSDEPQAFFHTPAWSGDGKSVFYKLRAAGMEPARLLVRHIEPGLERELHPSVYRFDVSPDGEWLAYSSFDEETEFLSVMPARGGPSRDVFREPRSGRIYSVTWTRDGRHLLFAKRGQLWRVPVAGGAPEELPLNMEALRELRVHPDGTQIAFTAGTAKGEVWVMRGFPPSP